MAERMEEQLQILSDPTHLDTLIVKCQSAQRELEQWTAKRREAAQYGLASNVEQKVDSMSFIVSSNG